MPTKAEVIAQQIGQKWIDDYTELLAHYSSTEVFEGINSFLKLNHTDSELQTALFTSGAYRKLLSIALLTLINRDALKPIVADLTEAGEEDLAKLRRETGLDLDLIPVLAPASPTAEELLEAQVRQDFATLPSSKMREKRNNDKRYEAMYQRIADTLGSSVTSLTRAGV
jgi:hypothetical protein